MLKECFREGRDLHVGEGGVESAIVVQVTPKHLFQREEDAFGEVLVVLARHIFEEQSLQHLRECEGMAGGGGGRGGGRGGSEHHNAAIRGRSHHDCLCALKEKITLFFFPPLFL